MNIVFHLHIFFVVRFERRGDGREKELNWSSQNEIKIKWYIGGFQTSL